MGGKFGESIPGNRILLLRVPTGNRRILSLENRAFVRSWDDNMDS